MSRVGTIVAAMLVAVAALLALTQPAAAHERRNVGPYQVVVGFGSEPAFAGSTNGASIRITVTRTTKPVEGVEKTLSVEIAAGGLKPLALPLRAVFGNPGLYQADFVPTKEGAYIFRFKGKIESLDVDEKFESGPGRFNDVEGVAKLQYPEQVPSGADLTKKLGDAQSTADQSRLLAVAGLALGIVAIGLTLRPRRG